MKCATLWKWGRRPSHRPPRFNVIEGKLPEPDVTDSPDAQDALWEERGAYWEAVAEAFPQSQQRSVLPISGHGALVRVDGNTLVVRHGFTHYPQQRAEVRYLPRDRELPERIVLLSCDGAITIRALEWLARQHVPVLLLDWRGNVVAALSGEASEPVDPGMRMVLQNLDASAATGVAKDLISKKLAAQMSTVELFPRAVARLAALEHLRRAQEAIVPAATVEEIRLVEARAASVYFRLWNRLPMRWKGLNSRPVAAEWLSVGVRSSALGATNRNATHPANAILNYAYAGLQSQTAISIAHVGLDQTMGILHARRLGRPALVFDLMEPLRPLVDAKVITFLLSHVFSRTDFPIGSDGVVRLHPQLARAIAGLRLPANIVNQNLQTFVKSVRALTSSASSVNRMSK